jgi:DUF4097 and DUF4098 domain-containing protein YvlB
MSIGRLSLAMDITRIPGREAEESTSARADRVAVWILLAIGLLLMLISAEMKADNGSATRTDRFNGTLAAGKSLHVENISGDVIATPGREFSATVSITVTGPTQRLADEMMSKTKILSEQDDDGWSLETHWPGANREGRRRSDPCDRCRVVARYELVIPPGVSAELKTVNGDVRVTDVDGELQLESVNGSIEARGVKHDFGAQTVNGGIHATAAAASAGQSLELQSVNGTIALTLPRDARFDFSASTMNGTISSSFPLPARGAGATRRVEKHGKKIVVHDEDGDVTDVDVDDLQREIEESMNDAQSEMDDEARREAERSGRHVTRQIHIVNPVREYSGSIGKDGASVQMTTLNGTVLLLAAGTKESDAKPLVSQRKTFTVTVPEVTVNVPPVHVNVPPVHVQVPPVHVQVPPPAPPARPGAVPPPPPPAPEPPDFDGEVVRGDVTGDFLSTTAGGNYRIGRVSGRVRILTHSGEIRVAGAGNGADLKTYGGDVAIGPVAGDLKISTAAGDIRGGAITGSASADTAGGDIRFERVGGNLDAKTAGGDVIAPFVGGSVKATTAGGDVRIGVSRDLRGGVTIHNDGGDVSLSLPPDGKAEVDLEVTGADDEDTMIRTDFPGLTVIRRPGTQRLTGAINGGGEKIVIRTSSGTIRLRKTPPAP